MAGKWKERIQEKGRGRYRKRKITMPKGGSELVVFSVLFGFVPDGRLVSCTLNGSVDLQVTDGSIQQDTPGVVTYKSIEVKWKEHWRKIPKLKKQRHRGNRISEAEQHNLYPEFVDNLRQFWLFKIISHLLPQVRNHYISVQLPKI